MKRSLNKLLLPAALALLLSGCGSDDSTTRKVLKVKYITQFTVNSNGRLGDDVPYNFQPRNSGNVYLFNPLSGATMKLGLNRRKLDDICRLPPVPAGIRLVGFSVDEKARRVSLFYVDSAVRYSFSGKRVSGIRFEGLSETGFIYPFESGFLPIFKNGKMYAPHYPSVPGDSRNPAYCTKPVEAEVDIATRRVRLLEQTFPASFSTSFYGLTPDPARTEISENVHAYSYPQNDSIFIRDISTGALEKKFFGSRMQKHFEYIPFSEMKSIHAGAIKEIGQKNPFYWMPGYFPQAGNFVRFFVLPPDDTRSGFLQYMILFDKELNYIGETLSPLGYPIDTKDGLMILTCAGGKLTLKKMTW